MVTVVIVVVVLACAVGFMVGVAYLLAKAGDALSRWW